MSKVGKAIEIAAGLLGFGAKVWDEVDKRRAKDPESRQAKQEARHRARARRRSARALADAARLRRRAVRRGDQPRRVLRTGPELELEASVLEKVALRWDGIASSGRNRSGSTVP